MLNYVNNRADPKAWARRVGVSDEAIAIYQASDVIDLHVDTTVPMRILGYDAQHRHRARIPGSPMINHVDLPRLREACVTGVVWDLPTNPLRTSAGRVRTATRNLRNQKVLFERNSDEFQLVRSASDYQEALESGRTAVWLSIQGGQAFDHGLEALDAVPAGLLHRITLVHFTTSRIGVSNALKGKGYVGLSSFGKAFVRRMDQLKIIVDLAHINRAGFFDAVKAHDPSLPLIVSHTGVDGVRPLWRNIGDDQIRAVAETGGTVGIIFNPSFLAPVFYTCLSARIVDHMEHVINVVGDDFVSLGSDFDGAITLPRDMIDVTEMPRLVQEMLYRGWSSERIAKILGGNYLRVVRMIHGE